MIFLGDIFLYLLTGLVHWWWAANLSFFGVTPNIAFIAALAAAILARPAKAITYGFFFGLYLDILGSSAFGAYALAYTLMAYGIYILKRHLDLAGGFPQIVAAFFLSVLMMLFYQGLSLLFARTWPLEYRAFLVEPFLNAALAPFVFHLFAQFKRRLRVL